LVGTLILNKMRKSFLNAMLKHSPENSLLLPRNRKKRKDFSYDVNDHVYSKSKNKTEYFFLVDTTCCKE